MKQIVISLAGRAIGITPLFSELEHFLQDYITEAAPDFTVGASAADIAFEREKSAREDRTEGHEIRRFSDAYLETLAV